MQDAQKGQTFHPPNPGAPRRAIPQARPQRAKRRRRTLRCVELLSEARTPLADFFSFLLEGIQRYTTGPNEVIVVDDHSTDGSAEFFEANGCQVIRKRWLLVSPSQIVERCRRQFDELRGRPVPQGGVQP